LRDVEAKLADLERMQAVQSLGRKH
jgi:hypothetical protein